MPVHQHDQRLRIVAALSVDRVAATACGARKCTDYPAGSVDTVRCRTMPPDSIQLVQWALCLGFESITSTFHHNKVTLQTEAQNWCAWNRVRGTGCITARCTRNRIDPDSNAQCGTSSEFSSDDEALRDGNQSFLLGRVVKL